MISTVGVVAVILNYNGGTDLIACIEAIKSGTRLPDRLVVVDNASTDDSIERISQLHPDVVILQTGANLGFAGGMNRGIQYGLQTGAEYLCMMNSDTVCDSRYLEELINALGLMPDAGAATGTIYHYPGSRVWYAGGDIVRWRGAAVSHCNVPANSGNEIQGPHSITFISGCAFVVRASAIRAAGGFDERFFMYYEDSELSARLTAHHFRLLHVPAARMLHRTPKVDLTPFRLYYVMRNRLLFVHLSLHGFSRAAAFSYLALVYAAKLVKWRFTNPPLFRAARIGIVDFFHGAFGKGRGSTFK